MTGVSRRTFITGSAAAAVLAGVGFNNTAEAAAIGNDGQTYRLTVMGTTDLHGNVFNWDYFKNAEYDDSAHNDIGLAKVSSLVNALRATRAMKHAADRCGRHHPGHAAGVLLREDQSDQSQGHPPDGGRDERHGVRRRGARQS